MWHLQVLQAGISAGVAHSGLQSAAFASQRRLLLPTEAPLVQQNAVTASCAAVEDAALASQPLAFAFLPHFNFEGAQAPVASLSQPQQVQEAYDSFAGWLLPAARLFCWPAGADSGVDRMLAQQHGKGFAVCTGDLPRQASTWRHCLPVQACIAGAAFP